MRSRWLLLLFLWTSACNVLSAQTPIQPGGTARGEKLFSFSLSPRPDAPAEPAVPNDNRFPAGTLREAVLELRLEARLAAWRPADADSEVTVLGFAEEGGPVRIPGPLLRVAQGTEVRVSVRNLIPDVAPIGLPPANRRRKGLSSIAGPVLVVRGLLAATGSDSTLRVPFGEVREVRLRAETPGTYLYWGATSDATIRERTGLDSQLTGAIVVDAAGVVPDPEERIFVITMVDALPDETQSPPGEDVFAPAINGLSWPHTERLHYERGETVRWRWVNGSGFEHPMHLHGFHFRTLGRGDGFTDTTDTENATRLVVTELLEPGDTFRMEWVPTRAGNWVMHCHIVDHITPAVPRDAEMRAHDLHDVNQHALTAMAGLVLGIIVSEPRTVNSDQLVPQQRLRLAAVERELSSDADCHESLGLRDPCMIRGFVLDSGTGREPDSVAVPGPALILTRGETTEITVINRLSEPTTVHWHGMELQSVYDGVAGWSRTGSRIAPLIAPGDSFVVYMTPPRAGTFIYHTHMDETDQLSTGMHGPLLVLEPGEVFDPESDRVLVIGSSVDYWVTINGRREPAPMTLRAGTEYRLRFINIAHGATVSISLEDQSGPVAWRGIAKDGADLPPSLQVEHAAQIRMGVGETYDFAYTPAAPGELTLRVHVPFPTEVGESVLRQVFRVRGGLGAEGSAARPLAAQTTQQRPLIIDMHLHAISGEQLIGKAGQLPPECGNPTEIPPVTPAILDSAEPGLEYFKSRPPYCTQAVPAVPDLDELFVRTLAQLKRYNIRAVTSGPLENVHKWRALAPDRIIPANGLGLPTPIQPDDVRALVKRGDIAVFAEVSTQYAGLAADDPALEPMFALAEELDVPVGIHIGLSAAGAPGLMLKTYRAAQSRPLALEPVLLRHPKLRIYVMHAGWPMLDETIHLLWSFPQVYVDIAVINWAIPRKEFHFYLRRLVEAGFGKRILFGSDQMVFPDSIPLAIESIETAEFLAAEQKRDIFCRNAARFLRLDPTECE
ncbi:MAG: amidohydrolase family protein [Candidatus Acidiferrales bacterium]